MHSILILTDLSEASFHAAEYGCHLARLLPVGKIILYHAYQTIIPTDLPGPSVDPPVAIVDPPLASEKLYRQTYLEHMESLNLLKDRLRPIVDPSIAIDPLAEESRLPEGIGELCHKEGIELIVMGVCGKSAVNRFLLGSNTARMLKISPVPLLIVPGEAFIGEEIQTIVFATDLKDISSLPVARLNTFLDAFGADICVLNVEQTREHEDSKETREAVSKLSYLLEKYHPLFYFIEGNDLVNSILGFARDYKASLIIAVPRSHQGLSAIFHQSITSKIAYNSSIPFLALPAPAAKRAG